VNKFINDGLKHIIKDHPLRKSDSNFKKQQRWFDEFILYADAEFHRFYKSLEASGALKNSWVILTSDHGEMFERGVQGHMTELLYEPLVRIPLVIFEPGQQPRKDIYSRTSSVDVIPTLLKITGQDIPEWCEGEVLPPYRDSEPDPARSIFALEAKHNVQDRSITNGTGMIVKEQYKLIHYTGFKSFDEGESKYELFDLENDPEEINNIAKANLNKTYELIDELRATMEEADKPYTK
jgi:arylsulfatase A-like enzyme